MAIASCDFRMNSASEYGAAVFAESYRTNLTISGSQFTTNGASWGGALSVLKTSADAFISSSDFTSNSADQGGAVYLYAWNDQTTHISSTLFSGNTASSPSSGVYGYDGNDDGCADTDGGATDPYGDDCQDYDSNPGWCNNYDDSDFSSNEMCCGCGGGEAGPGVANDIYLGYDGALQCESSCPDLWGSSGSSCAAANVQDDTESNAQCYSCDCFVPSSLPTTAPSPFPYTVLVNGSPTDSLGDAFGTCTGNCDILVRVTHHAHGFVGSAGARGWRDQF